MDAPQVPSFLRPPRVPGTFLIGCRLREERLSQPQLAAGSEGPGGVPDPWVLIPLDGALPSPGEHTSGGRAHT